MTKKNYVECCVLLKGFIVFIMLETKTVGFMELFKVAANSVVLGINHSGFITLLSFMQIRVHIYCMLSCIDAEESRSAIIFY